jgi:hypothetical protein
MNREIVKQELIEFFFKLKNNIYLYHLSTYAYSRHIAASTLLDKFDTLIDSFLEIYFGKYGRPSQFVNTKIDLIKLSDGDAYMELSTYIDYLNNRLSEIIDSRNSDLFNIRDEMVGILNSTKYLFELK